MFGTPITPEQRLQKAVIDIMANPKYTALAGVIMIGERSISDSVPTACTNGRDEFYGRAFVESLNDAELRFLVLHEVYHKLYQHLTTWRWMYDKNQQLANIACDYVINIKLVDDNTDGFAKMTGPLGAACFDPKYRNWDSAQVFHDLNKQQEADWGQGQGQGQGSFDEHDWDGAKDMSIEEQHALSRDIDEALRQGAMAAGKMGSGGDRGEFELLEPQVDWRAVMREFISTTCAGSDYSTWSRPNRRYLSAGMFMPSGISEQVGEIVVAIDTSGSIGGRELSVMLSEVKAIADTVHPEAIRLLYWDTRVCADEVYAGADIDNITNSTKPAGGGGTMVECVPEHIAKEGINAQAVIVLTDGYLGGSWGNWSQPVLWVMLDNKSANPNTGKTLHVKSHQM